MSVYEDIEFAEDIDDLVNGSWSLSEYLMELFDVYGLYYLQQCVSFCYALYLRITLLNTAIFCLKDIPTFIYAYKLMKSILQASRERLKVKKIELEDIQLQIQIVNTKVCVRDSEYNERCEVLRREAARLRRVRARVRDVIASDHTLRRALDTLGDCDYATDNASPQEDNNIINELLKTRDSIPEKYLENLEHERAESEPAQGEHTSTPYSSLSDTDVTQNCGVKIVKVTNVYKVAYLKNYIKQRKLRRATKRAALKKKMENIKQLLDNWQKTLSMVINSKLTILNIDAHPIDLASQEAMGDYSKPRDSSDSDSEIRSDMYYDEYSLCWTQNPYRPFSYNYEEASEPSAEQNCFEQQDNGDVKYSAHFQCEGLAKCPVMTSIVEETGSQMAIEEVAWDEDDNCCRDLVVI